MHCSRSISSSSMWWYSRVTENGKNRLVRELSKRMQFCVSFTALVTQRELSNTAKLSAFKSVLVPILIYGHESWVMTENNPISSTSGRDGIFEKCSRRDNFATKCAAVKFVKRWMPSHLSSERETLATAVQSRDQNAPRNIGEESPACWTHGKAAQRSSKEQAMWLHHRPCLFPS